MIVTAPPTTENCRSGHMPRGLPAPPSQTFSRARLLSPKLCGWRPAKRAEKSNIQARIQKSARKGNSKKANDKTNAQRKKNDRSCEREQNFQSTNDSTQTG